MSGVIFTRGIVTGLGVAAGTLAVAALLGTAPIATADNNGNEIDWATLASPAATFPELTYNNTFTLALGSTVDTWSTTFTGSGLPTTVETMTTLPVGTTEFGSEDILQGDLLTSASHGDAFSTLYEALTTMTGGVTSESFIPFESALTTF